MPKCSPLTAANLSIPGLSEENKVQTPAFTDAVRLYRQAQGHYGTWEMMCGVPSQVSMATSITVLCVRGSVSSLQVGMTSYSTSLMTYNRFHIVGSKTEIWLLPCFMLTGVVRFYKLTHSLNSCLNLIFPSNPISCVHLNMIRLFIYCVLSVST